MSIREMGNLKLVLVLVCTMVAAAAAQTKSGCDNKCGNVSIPYPFGTSENCYIDKWFSLNCTNTTTQSPSSEEGTTTQLIYSEKLPVVNISLDPPELTILANVSNHCYDSSYTSNEMSLIKFSISNTKNRFIEVGCDTYAYIRDLSGTSFSTGCRLTCSKKTSFKKGSCSGLGCCETSFPEAMRHYNIHLGSYNNYAEVRDFNPCSYAFLAKNGSFHFSSWDDLLNLRNETQFPVVVDWAVANHTCHEAQKNESSYACKDNSRCINSPIGHYCRCREGFRGNPYLSHPIEGCKDINECDEEHRCSRICHNVPGNYTCSCPQGYRGDGYKDGSGCKFRILEISLGGSTTIEPSMMMGSKQSISQAISFRNQRLLTKTNTSYLLWITFSTLFAGISIALLVIITLVSTLCWGKKQRELEHIRRKNFEQNIRNYMMQQLYQHQKHIDRTRLFTEDELKTATNNFNANRILGCGGQGTVYKEILPNNIPVAIKKSRIGGDPRQIKDFINEVAVLSQINHRNVVKLFGCCLETEVPLLVYEFVDNGTLLDHIDLLKNEHPLSWETRLRIAAETAEAISYLHSAASIPIIHRDIKSANILLDHNHKAKVSDFGASRLVPLDETQATTMVQGTLGYLDPESLLTGQLNEKSDVYSFGVVLVELITGNKAIGFNRPEQRNLAMYLESSMREDNYWELLDKRVLDENNAKQIKEVAFLARRCIRVNGEERPTMREVAVELEGLVCKGKHPWVKEEDMMSKECESLLDHMVGGGGYGNSSADTLATYDEIQKQLASEIAGGR